MAERAAGLLAAYVAAGTSHIRSHVDVDSVAGLDSLHGVMEAREAFADRVDVELVAFPQSGLLVRPGTAGLLEAAVRAGAELVGGLDPAGFDQRPVEHLDASSPSPAGTAAASTSTCTTAASWARSPST